MTHNLNRSVPVFPNSPQFSTAHPQDSTFYDSLNSSHDELGISHLIQKKIWTVSGIWIPVSIEEYSVPEKDSFGEWPSQPWLNPEKIKLEGLNSRNKHLQQR